ncbi:MAG: CPBP family intramembrane metalloprotease, partial [Acidobacteria bacterium]|nr:CPBP family intramembrane metalloprotease [Acidobacteriota bacterium]
LANFLALAAFAWLRATFVWETTLEEVFHKTHFVVSIQTGWEILWFLFIYFTATRKYRQKFWQAIRWVPGPARPLNYLLAGAGLALAAQLLFYWVPSEKNLPIERLFSSPGSAYLLAVFGICVAPFAEELVFRGFFYPVFERLWGFLAAVVLTSLLFAFVHMPQLSGGWVEILAIFGVGLVFSYCRGKTRSLLPPYLMHLTYNACLFVWLYVSTDQFRSLGNP